MKKIFTHLILIGFLVIDIPLVTNAQIYCNPINLSYSFSQEDPSRRKVSDPTIVLYKDNYYLFATNAGGYWHSTDLVNWELIQTADLPLENEAPAPVVIGDWLYFFTSNSDKIYRTNNPSGGKWDIYNHSFYLSMISDFCVFADTDGRVYCYYGCSNNDGLMVRELDTNNKLNPKGVPTPSILKNASGQGWKRPADKQKKIGVPGVSGSWMNKFKGKYYYQFTEPDPGFGNYNEVVYVSDNPFGPFTYAAHNPYVSKPNGFVSTIGKGSTFTDKYGNWWHITTMTAPDKLPSTTRLGLFPTVFDADNLLITHTDFGDFPIKMPDYKYSDVSELRPGWSLLSYNKFAEASSHMATNPVNFALDENLGTFWSAQLTDKKEWLCVDLGSVCTINAVQINFEQNNTRLHEGRDTCEYQYIIHYSTDKNNWKTLSDQTKNKEFLSHPLEVMKTPVDARFIKITSHCMPKGRFAISGIRVFGAGNCPPPTVVKTFLALRDRRDPRKIKLSWSGKQKYVTGYNIRYGTQKDKLYHNYQAFKNAPLVFHGLAKNKTYWFEVDAFGENGITPSIVHITH